MLAELQNLSKSELIKLLEKESQQAQKIEQQYKKIEHKNSNLELEVLYLKEQLERIKRFAFGQKSERFEGNPAQPQLPFEMSEEAAKELEEHTAQQLRDLQEANKQEAADEEAGSDQNKKAKSKHRGRAPLPAHLPVEEIEIYPEGDLTNMVCIGKEVTEELDHKPATYYIRRTIRYKYVLRDADPAAEGTKVHIAPLPEQIIPKGSVGIALLTAILVDKYVDHLPLDRQGKRLARQNIPIASSTLEGWKSKGLKILYIFYQHLLNQTRAKGYLQADESPIKVQDPKNKKGSCHLGYYWVYHCPMDGSVLFDYQPGRGSGAAAHVLDGYKGYLQTDGYGVYDQFGKREGVTHLACWAHARREFHNALDNDREKAEEAMKFIQTLYGVEATAREQNLSPAARYELRQAKALPTAKAFAKWLHATFNSGQVLPRSPIGKAMAYSLNRWDQLTAYLNDGRLEIDNNSIENAIRPLALGRKNYLFAGSHDAAKRAAAAYSFFAMCKKEGVNPYNWLKYVFEHINDTKMTALHTLYPAYLKAEGKV
jgi:transposase